MLLPEADRMKVFDEIMDEAGAMSLWKIFPIRLARQVNFLSISFSTLSKLSRSLRSLKEFIKHDNKNNKNFPLVHP